MAFGVPPWANPGRPGTFPSGICSDWIGENFPVIPNVSVRNIRELFGTGQTAESFPLVMSFIKIGDRELTDPTGRN